MKYAIIFLLTFNCFAGIKYHLKNSEGKITHDVSSANPSASEIPKNWGYILDGWYTASQLKEMGLVKTDRTSRVVIDREEKTYPVEIGKDFKTLEDFQQFCFENKVVCKADSYTTDVQDHKEFWVDKNYSIEVKDNTAQELAEKAQADADKQELKDIKDIIQAMPASDLKRILKRIVKVIQ